MAGHHDTVVFTVYGVAGIVTCDAVVSLLTHARFRSCKHPISQYKMWTIIAVSFVLNGISEVIDLDEHRIFI